MERVLRAFFVLAALPLVLAVAGCRRDHNVPAKPVSHEDTYSLPRIALAFGNSNYTERNALSSPTLDAERISEVLADRGFTVALKTDSDIGTMRRAIYELSDTLSPRGGIAFFYYSGHAIQHDGQLYLIPVEAQLEDVIDLRVQAISLNEIVETISSTPASAVIIVIDACRDNPFSPADSPPGGIQGNPSVAVRAGTDYIISFSTSPGSAAFDGTDGALSPYTETLARNLERPEVYARDVFTEAASQTAATGLQQPWLVLSGTLDFKFAPHILPPSFTPGSVSTDEPHTLPCASLQLTQLKNQLFLSNTHQWPFPTDPTGEDATGAFNPEWQRSGLVTKYPILDDPGYARIPLHTLSANIHLENMCTHELLLEELTLTVVDEYPVPSTAQQNMYMGVIEPRQLRAVIEQGKDVYRLLEGQPHSAEPRRNEYFTIDIIAPTDLPPAIYRFELHAHVVSNGQRAIVPLKRQIMIAATESLSKSPGAPQVSGQSSRDLAPPELTVTSDQELERLQKLSASAEGAQAIRGIYDCEMMVCAGEYSQAVDCFQPIVDALAKMASYNMVIFSTDDDPEANYERLSLFTAILAAYVGDIERAQAILAEAADICNCTTPLEYAEKIPSVADRLSHDPKKGAQLIKEAMHNDLGSPACF